MKLEKFRHGQIMLLMTLAIATLLGVMALGTDVGVMYYTHLQLQKGADAGALAGANYLNETATGEKYNSANAGCLANASYDDAEKAACTYALNNGLAADTNSLTLTEAPASATPNTPNIQVIAKRSNLPYMFGRVIGLTTYNVAAVSTATQGANGGTTDLFCMGFQCTGPCSSIPLQQGDTVPFNDKFSPTGSSSGNWQWLSNPNSGNKDTPGEKACITSGMTGTYAIGGTVTTKPGNNVTMSNQTITAFNNRFSTLNCPSLASDPCATGSTTVPPTTDPCLIVVPAVDFSGSGGSSTLTIEAFAEVYIEPGSTATNINACFVKQLDPNSVASGGPNLGSLGRPVLVQ